MSVLIRHRTKRRSAWGKNASTTRHGLRRADNKRAFFRLEAQFTGRYHGLPQVVLRAVTYTKGGVAKESVIKASSILFPPPDPTLVNLLVGAARLARRCRPCHCTLLFPVYTAAGWSLLRWRGGVGGLGIHVAFLMMLLLRCGGVLSWPAFGRRRRVVDHRVVLL